MKSAWLAAPNTARRKATLSKGGWMQLKRRMGVSPCRSFTSTLRLRSRFSIDARSGEGVSHQSTSPACNAEEAAETDERSMDVERAELAEGEEAATTDDGRKDR